MKHLIIAPHPDDEVLGCGGVIAKRIARGEAVHVIYVVTSDSEQFSTAGFSSAGTRLHEMAAVSGLLGFTYELYYNDPSKHERLDSVPQRELIDRFQASLDEHRPDVVYIPAREDFDQDHRAIFDAAHTALRPHPREYRHFVPQVLVYEQPKMGWAPDPFHPNCFEDITAFLDKKLQALELHTSQLRKRPHTRSPENLTALAHLRGAQVGVLYAEAFLVLRDFRQ
jgi:LmbE family N-acetylglucosaminyl deacetylase